MPSQLIQQLSERNIHIFLEAYCISNDQGEPLDFRDHPYLWDIFSDMSPRQVILKAAQIGMSTTINLKAFWIAKNYKMDIIYSLPSSADIKDFVAGKTNRLIAHNAIFQEWCEDKDSIEQKRVGNNVIYFKGTWTERAAIATPADLYISDETDRSKQEIVTQFKTRLQHSKKGWEWYLSNPSAPGNGVDKYWEISDQKYWFVKCTCGHEWYITMDNIMVKDNVPYFGCLKCHGELNRRKGRWIARYKDRLPDGYSGYWIPLLIVPTKSAAYILEKKKELDEEQFTNFVLGLPYIGRGNKLTRQMFVQNLIDTVNPRDKTMIIGVDTGTGINYELMNEYGTFFYDKVSSYEPLKKLMRDNPTAIMVIDQGGDIVHPREMREEFPNRVYLCFFRADQKNDKLITWNDDEGTVVADRNKLIQLCIDEIMEKRNPFFGTEADWNEYMLEWLGMYRTQEVTALGTPIFKWNKPATGRCDYPFAHVYARIGLDRFSNFATTFHDGRSLLPFGSQGYENTPSNTTRL